jgi:hypothetical protein
VYFMLVEAVVAGEARMEPTQEAPVATVVVATAITVVLSVPAPQAEPIPVVVVVVEVMPPVMDRAEQAAAELRLPVMLAPSVPLEEQ